MATLSRFDKELKELDRVIKEKKGIVTKADLSIQEFLHDVQVLNKDKTSAANKVVNLEATHEWIAQDKEWVATLLPPWHGFLRLTFFNGFLGNSGNLVLSMTGGIRTLPILTIR